MKYCTNCGAALPEGTQLCRSCGHGISLAKPLGSAQAAAPLVQQGNAPMGGRRDSMAAGAPQGNAVQGGSAWRQGSAFPPQQAPSGGSSGKAGLLIGCGVLLVIGLFLLVVGGVGYYLYSTSRDEAKPAAPPQQTRQTQPAAQEKAAGKGSAEWNDLVREKDEIDIAIGEIANRANQHLKSYPDFRNAPGLTNDARAVLERARKAESRAASLRGADPAGANALRSLFAVEVHRAQGLYKGMVDSSNGGDYSYGFSEGTTASYAFDQANADFDRLYR